MVSIDRIPFENRWRLATAGAMDLAMAYSVAVRGTLGEAFGEALDEMEEGFWEQAGLEQITIARAFGFPLRTAREVAQYQRKLGRDMEEKQVAELSERGMSVEKKIDKAAWRKVMQPVIDQVGGQFGKEKVDAILGTK